MAINSLHELATTKFWQMEPKAFGFYRDQVLRNMELRVPFVAEKNTEAYIKQNAIYGILQTVASENGQGVTVTDKTVAFVGSAKVAKADNQSGRVYIGNAVIINRYADEFGITAEDTIVNMVNVVGPVTCNSGMCSYGSMDMRDQMLMASNIPNVAGHLIYINTPGGSSAALQDFQYAFDYARKKGLSIIGLVDKMAASMGAGIASQCDELYFVNPKDEIGCIGTYAAFFTSKDGDVNTITQERYCEVYATDSVEKNKWYRDASEGDYKLVQEEVNAANDYFKVSIKAGRPSILDEQMTGKMYPCGEVIGTMVDGQSTIGEVATLIVERMPSKKGKSGTDSGSSRNTAAGKAPQASASNASQQGEKVIGSHESKIDSPASSPKDNANPNKDNMKHYPSIESALEIKELGSDPDNGVYLAEELADTLESKLLAKIEEMNSMKEELASATERATLAEQNMASATETAATQKQEIDELKAQLDAANASVISEKERADKAENDFEGASASIETLKGEHATAIEALNTEHATAIEALNNTLAKKDRDIEALQTENAELKGGPGATAPAGEQPRSNNTIAPKDGPVASSVYNENLSPAENFKRLEERNKQLRESRSKA